MLTSVFKVYSSAIVKVFEGPLHENIAITGNGIERVQILLAKLLQPGFGRQLSVLHWTVINVQNEMVVLGKPRGRYGHEIHHGRRLY